MNPFDEPYTEVEKLRFQSLFNSIDTTNKGMVTPQQTVLFLKRSSLEQHKLSMIWNIADADKKGYLSKDDFFVALKLVALAQIGKEISRESLSLPSPLPIFVDSVPVQFTGDSIRSAPEFTITPEEIARFKAFYDSAGAKDGKMPGSVAKEIFMKSQLANDVLSKVWMICDKDGTGVFTQSQFVLAMAIISKYKQGSITSIPASVSPAIWASITGSDPSRPSPLMRTNSIVSPKLRNAGMPIMETPNMQQPLSNEIIALQEGLTPSEKAQYKQFFDQLDTSKTGLLSGAECSPFFLKSKLNPQDLAIVW